MNAFRFGTGPARRLALCGCLFVAAANAVALSDAGFGPLSLSFAAVVAVSALLVLAVALPLSRLPAGGAAVFALGMTYFLDVTFVGGGWIAAIGLVMVAGLLAFMIEYRKASELVAFCATAVAVATMFIVGQQSATRERLAPSSFDLSGANGEIGHAYLHIILDEMGSTDMMPPGDYYDALKVRIVADYADRGFDLFTDTMATSGDTRISLSRALAVGGADSNRPPYAVGDDVTYEISSNGAAEKLAGAGYRVSILQNDYLGICPSDAWNCKSYARSGEGASLFAYADGFVDRLRYVFFELHASLVAQESVRASSYYSLIAGLAGAETPYWRPGLTRPSLVLTVMQQARESLRHLGPGQAFFAHLLLPHFPYVLDDRCNLKPPGERAAPAWVGQGEGGIFSPERAERSYWEQVACTHDALMAMVDAVSESPAGEDSVIVIHGDHGSRLFEKVVDPQHDHASPADRRHALITHFAVRGVPGVHDELARSQMLEDRVGVVLEAVAGAAPASGKDAPG